MTISQLLVHRAGFGRKADTANAPLGAYLRNNTARRTAFDTQLKWVIGRKLPLEPGTRYAYSNAAYLILGAVIEETSGQDYESFCRQNVLLPLGARDAALDPNWRILSSYGGWRMPLSDYGRFYQAFALGNPAIGPVSRAWMMSPVGKQVGGGVHYGLGTFVRPTAVGGGNFWHWGAWTYTLPGASDGPLKTSYSSFAVRWGDDRRQHRGAHRARAWQRRRAEPARRRPRQRRQCGEKLALTLGRPVSAACRPVRVWTYRAVGACRAVDAVVAASSMSVDSRKAGL